MKLYEFAPAPNPRRVRQFLAEKGVEVERIAVDMLGGAHKTPAFRAKSPLAQLPVLELDDGTYLTESIAICRYFEGLHPTPPLFGADLQAQAVIEMWNRRVEFGITAPAIYLLRHTSEILAHLQEQDEGEAARHRQRLLDGLSFLDGELAVREFVSPTGFSVADITAFVGLDFTLHGTFEIPADMTNVKRWYDMMKARPSSSA
ncbi:MAG: glutathione S-transferase family protein [Alphaproteobacteria bacterium]